MSRRTHVRASRAVGVTHSAASARLWARMKAARAWARRARYAPLWITPRDVCATRPQFRSAQEKDTTLTKEAATGM